MWQCHIMLFFGFAATRVMWQRHIMHSMDLVQPELAGIESIQCRVGLMSELVLSGEMSSEISKLKSGKAMWSSIVFLHSGDDKLTILFRFNSFLGSLLANKNIASFNIFCFCCSVNPPL